MRDFVSRHGLITKILITTGLALVAAVSVALVLGGQDDPSNEPTVEPSTQQADLMALADGRTLGDPNAPVYVVEWGNYK